MRSMSFRAGPSAQESTAEELVPAWYKQDFPLPSGRHTIALIAKPVEEGRPG
jgi:hypothetical protein